MYFMRFQAKSQCDNQFTNLHIIPQPTNILIPSPRKSSATIYFYKEKEML